MEKRWLNKVKIDGSFCRREGGGCPGKVLEEGKIRDGEAALKSGTVKELGFVGSAVLLGSLH